MLFLLLAFAQYVSGQRRVVRARRPAACEASSLCELCPAHAAATEACQATGRRYEMTCRRGGPDAEPTRLFASCDRTADDERLQLIYFELWMILIGGLSYFLVKRRKNQTQSLYDRRASSSSTPTTSSRRGLRQRANAQTTNSAKIRQHCCLS